MKKNLIQITTFIIGVLLISCNNAKTNQQSNNEKMSIDSIPTKLESECIVACEPIFKELGDTIFGEVLFGMNKSQAKKKIRAFQDKLDRFKYKRYKQPDGNGFVFAEVEFMDINIVDIEKEVLDVTTTRGRYYSSFTWNGKLAQIVWNSFSVSRYSKADVSAQLEDFISYFENKYGRCTTKGVSSKNWFYIDYNGHKNYFPGGTVAEWKTDNRLLQISIEGKKCPEYGNERGEYRYTIYVRFFDRSIETDIESYIKEKEEKKNNKNKEQRQKSMNAL